MATNNQDILGLGPLQPDPRFSPDPTFFLNGEGNALSHDFSTIGKGTLRQKMVMDAICNKAHHAILSTSDLCLYADTTFKESSLEIALANKAAQNECNAAYMEAFSHRLIQLNARYMMGVLEVGAFKIVQEVNRQLLTPPQPQPSFLKRLLG